MKQFKTFLLFFSIQFLSYAMLCWNYRSVAQARYGGIFFSDLACAAISFNLIKKVANTNSRVAMAGYVLGGAFGSIVSVWVTKSVFGQ